MTLPLGLLFCVDNFCWDSCW